MRYALSGLIGYFVVVAAVGGGDDPARDDLKRLQGTWRAVKVMLDGQDLKAGYTQTIEGDRILYGGGFYGKFKLDAKAKPKAIDIDNYSPGSKKPRPGEQGYKGIYAFDGEDTLKWIIAQKVDAPRPTSFESKPGDNCRFVIMQRVKDGDKSTGKKGKKKKKF
jgi:uncharacterized protein (TIGR03067 family)